MAILYVTKFDVLSALGLGVEFVSEAFVVFILLVSIGFGSILSHFVNSSIVTEKQESRVPTRFLESLDSDLLLQIDRRIWVDVRDVIYCGRHLLSLMVKLHDRILSIVYCEKPLPQILHFLPQFSLDSFDHINRYVILEIFC